jgi:hypothetical protein
VITWSAADSDGVAVTTLEVDGKAMGPVYGPYGTNYAAALGTLAPGSHAYVIRATDAAGAPVSTQYTGTFNVAGSTPSPTPAGPAIANIVIAELNGNGDGIIQASEKIVVTWSLSDPDGIFSTSAMMDNLPAKAVYGPYGVNYSAVFDPLSAGSHSLTIRAADSSSAHTASQYSGTINIAQAAAVIFAKSADLGTTNGQTSSAKTDWLLNLDGVTASTGTKKSDSTNAVDMVLASY